MVDAIIASIEPKNYDTASLLLEVLRSLPSGLWICLQYPLQRSRSSSKRGILCITLNCIWWWESSSKFLGSELWFTLNRLVVSLRVPSLVKSSIGLYAIMIIKIFKKILVKITTQKMWIWIYSEHDSLVGLGCWIHRLHLWRGVKPPNECPDMTLNNLMVRFQ